MTPSHPPLITLAQQITCASQFVRKIPTADIFTAESGGCRVLPPCRFSKSECETDLETTSDHLPTLCAPPVRQVCQFPPIFSIPSQPLPQSRPRYGIIASGECPAPSLPLTSPTLGTLFCLFSGTAGFNYIHSTKAHHSQVQSLTPGPWGPDAPTYGREHFVIIDAGVGGPNVACGPSPRSILVADRHSPATTYCAMWTSTTRDETPTSPLARQRAVQGRSSNQNERRRDADESEGKDVGSSNNPTPARVIAADIEAVATAGFE
ncbi:hypothetical protein C8R46DRAFT_1042403 [Mycena filopes]|nr:hypothetical protein C8R46DRAFT_1042403 [Mycena filopes]